MFAQAARDAGVGRDANKAAAPAQPATDELGRDLDVPGDYPEPNFLNFYDNQEEDDDETTEDIAPPSTREDPRVALMEAQLKLQQQQMDQMIALLQKQQAASAPAPAPVDPYAGYNPTLSTQGFLEDPDKAMPEVPAWKKLEARLAMVEHENRQMKTFINEQQFYETSSLNDPEDRKMMKTLLAEDPYQVYLDSLELRKIKANQAAQAAQGIKAQSRPVAPDRSAETKRALAMRERNSAERNILSLLSRARGGQR